MKYFSEFLEHRMESIESLQNCHKDVEDIVKMADSPWKVPTSSFQGLSEDRLMAILISSPISCIRVRSKMFVIGGFRSWNIVKIYCELNGKKMSVPVQIVKRRMNKKQRREFAIYSLFMPLLSHALGQCGQEYIGHLWTSLKDKDPDFYKSFFSSRKSSKSRLPKDFGQSYGSFYPKGAFDE